MKTVDAMATTSKKLLKRKCNVSIENLKILAETTTKEFPDATLERFIKDALVEYETLKKANDVLSIHNGFLQNKLSAVSECIDDLFDLDLPESIFEKILTALEDT